MSLDRLRLSIVLLMRALPSSEFPLEQKQTWHLFPGGCEIYFRKRDALGSQQWFTIICTHVSGRPESFATSYSERCSELGAIRDSRQEFFMPGLEAADGREADGRCG